jgi:hypothetical protein
VGIIVIALIVFVAILVVAYPLFNPARYRLANARNGAGQYDSLQSARTTVIDAIRDLEFEHATGKLSNGDYQYLRSRYDLQAMGILQQLDALSSQRPVSAEAEDEIERAVASLRAKKTAAPDICPNCRARVEPGDRFCAKCGAVVNR